MSGRRYDLNTDVPVYQVQINVSGSPVAISIGMALDGDTWSGPALWDDQVTAFAEALATAWSGTVTFARRIDPVETDLLA